jgi:hypothetical protein
MSKYANEAVRRFSNREVFTPYSFWPPVASLRLGSVAPAFSEPGIVPPVVLRLKNRETGLIGFTTTPKEVALVVRW